MFRDKKKQLIFSSVAILFPIVVGLLLWDRLPETLTTHWGFDSQADGWASLPVAVFVPPLLMLAGHWLCIYFTGKDPDNMGRNRQLGSIVLWFIPLLSNLVCLSMYAIALGRDFPPVAPMMVLMGLMFAVIGNYLPKTRMNGTMGIKVYWAYTSQENWDATHRFGGKVWFIGGIALMFTVFLPEKWAVAAMLVSILVLAVIPVVYSWLYYRKQMARGDSLEFTRPAMVRKAGKFVGPIVAALLIFVAVVMFTGSIDVHLEEDAMHIEASWYNDLTVKYDTMESAELRQGDVDGIRVGGFGSTKLLMGFFRNEEFGNYTRYTVTNPECCIVIYTQRSVLVVSGDTAEETQFIYESLLAKIG